MKFDWNEDTIQWYREANDYTGFFKNIAQLIKPRIKGYSSLCDIGCGLGLLDLELYKCIENITCVDISCEAINSLQQTIDENKIDNMKTQIVDCNEIHGKWDIICICFFGSREIEKFLPHCKKMIAVIHGDHDDKLSPPEYRSFKKRTSKNVEETLKAKGIQYCVTHTAFEFGQPLTSMEDAKKFIKNHTPKIMEQDLELFLTENLIKTGEEKYPFFLPRMKSIGIFEIDGWCK